MFRLRRPDVRSSTQLGNERGTYRRAVSIRFAQYLRGRLQSGNVCNAGWTFFAKSVQLLGRVAYFTIVANVLGPDGYGTFVACTALIAILSPFACFGSASVLIKHASRDRDLFRPYFGNAIIVTLASASVLTVVVLCIRTTVLPQSATVAMVLSICVADLVGLQLSTLCSESFVLSDFRKYTQLTAWSVLVRCIAAIVLAASTRTATHWAYLYALSTLISTLTGITVVSCVCGLPRFQLRLIIPSLREGIHFSTSSASQSVYNDIDKTMLARMSSVEDAAIYAVAYRFIEAAMLPIRAVTAVTYPDFFRRGAQGVTSSFGLARPMIRRSAVYGLGVAIPLFVGAGAVPLIMGKAYTESTSALRWLCLLPAIKSVHAFLTDTLTGADFQWQRSLIQSIVAAVNILLNFWVIRAFAWRGAACSSVFTDLLLAVLLYAAIHWHIMRERGGDRARVDQPRFV